MLNRDYWYRIGFQREILVNIYQLRYFGSHIDSVQFTTDFPKEMIEYFLQEGWVKFVQHERFLKDYVDKFQLTQIVSFGRLFKITPESFGTHVNHFDTNLFETCSCCYKSKDYCGKTRRFERILWIERLIGLPSAEKPLYNARFCALKKELLDAKNYKDFDTNQITF